jgi:nucleotide-binding universal stress UspA family protein
MPETGSTLQKKILVALDDSPRAPNVFDTGAQYCRALNAELYLYRTLTVPQEFPAAAAYPESDHLAEVLASSARRDLDELARRAPDVQVKDTLVGFGLPGQMILETAESLNVDLIVIGSHGYHGWDRVLGTTAATIANRSKRNVLVVHSTEAAVADQ